MPRESAERQVVASSRLIHVIVALCVVKTYSVFAETKCEVIVIH